jgi:hypothetical protein
MLGDSMIWTAISYNWSCGLTSFNVFHGMHSHTDAAAQFTEKFPGENLLALVAGSHDSSTQVYPLLMPTVAELQSVKEDS